MGNAANKPYWEDQALSRLIRNLSEGEYLFRQDEMGNTMFLIIEGTVQLFLQNQQHERLVWTLGRGEMLGEKAILQDPPYRRTVTAQARTSVTLLEFDSKNLKTIQEKYPDFMLKLLRMLSERLDQSNQLISILHLKEDINRATLYLLFYAQTHSTLTPEGAMLTLTTQQIANSINAPLELVDRLLAELISQKLIAAAKTGYIIPDLKNLEANIRQVSTKLAA